MAEAMSNAISGWVLDALVCRWVMLAGGFCPNVQIKLNSNGTRFPAGRMQNSVWRQNKVLPARYVSLFSWDTTSIQKSAKLLVRCARSMLGTVGI